MKRPIILLLVGHYLPGFRMGGPLRSVVNLVGHLHEHFDFRIVTSDRDLGDAAPYPGIEPNRWMPVGHAMVHYTTPERRTLRRLASIISSVPHDLLYLNSFFSPSSTIAPLVARRLGMLPRRPVLIAPRGEFSSSALQIKSLKKQAWLTLARSIGLYSGLAWQASSPADTALIAALMRVPESDIDVAANLPTPLPAAPPSHRPRQLNMPLRVAFLSRISPMKNLDYALRVLASVRAPVDFSIYGPEEDATHVAACRALAAALPSHIRVQWCGPTDPAEVPAAFARHDLFFFPTRGENFGHVIAESLGAGTPVLLSDKTPWRGLAEKGIGHDLPLADPAGFVGAIEAAAAESPEAALARRERVFAFALDRQRNSPDVEANRLLFATALGTRS